MSQPSDGISICSAFLHISPVYPNTQTQTCYLRATSVAIGRIYALRTGDAA